jgi:hypothetical protein
MTQSGMTQSTPRHPLTAMDRLRIERVVWLLDQRIYDLPRQSRIAKRREVRENLRTAAMDVGTTQALKNLGGTRRLAMEYRAAEFGDEARPHWYAAALTFLTGQLFLTAFLGEAATAFGDGIRAMSPHATGTYVWPGIAYLQTRVTYTFVDGTSTQVGGAWTPFAWILWGAVAVAAGRLWRVRWTRHRKSGSSVLAQGSSHYRRAP